MSTLTYDVSPAARVATQALAPARTRNGLFARIVARMIAARHRQAMAELRRRGLRLPSELEKTGWKIDGRSEDSLPFVR